jgi:hypothetical protein
MTPLSQLLPSFILLPLLASSCKRLEERVAITESRELSQYARKQAVDIPTAARFYEEEKEEEDPNAPREHPLLWTTPDGWTEKPVSQMRLIDLAFGPSGEGECYLAALPGPAGGLAANINRWRGQMGAAPLSDEEIEKLPRKTFLGGPAHFVSVEGDFKGMGDAADAKKGYVLQGIIHQAPELTLFIKMTGPKALVEQNTAAFEAFCNSVEFRKRSGKIPQH